MGQLDKLSTVTLISAAVAAQPAVASIPFWLYATPPPLGFAYRPLASAAGFSSWSQLYEPPRGVSTTVAGYWRLTVAQLASGELGYTSITLPVGTKYIYGMVDGVYQVIAWDIPTLVTAPLPPQWYGPIARMTYVTFPGHATHPNGYPIASGVISGRFRVPTAAGGLNVVRDYAKDSRGVWMPVMAYPSPTFCTMGGSCKVTMLKDFPGAPATPGVPAVYHTDDHAGWNAGSDSVLELNGDLHVVFSIDVQAAAALGFTRAREDVTTFANLTHAFYFDTGADGSSRYGVVELGHRRLAQTEHAGVATAFEIKRVNGLVSYLVDDVVVFVSSTPSYGLVYCGTALYRAGDSIL